MVEYIKMFACGALIVPKRIHPLVLVTKIDLPPQKKNKKMRLKKYKHWIEP